MKARKPRARIFEGLAAAVIVITVAVGTLAYNQLRTIRATAARITGDAMPSVYLMGKIQSSTLHRYALLTDRIYANNEVEKVGLDRLIEGTKSDVDDVVTRYDKLIVAPKDRQLFEALKSARGPYRESYARVLLLSRNNKRIEALQLMVFQLIPLRNAFLRAVEAELAWNKADADDAAHAIAAAVNWTFTDILIFLGVSVWVAATAYGVSSRFRVERKLW